MNPLLPLERLVAQQLQPIRREVWLGLGFLPPKRCAIAIDPANLPKEADCKAVAGLDVIVIYRGSVTGYGTIRRLSDALYKGGPRRLQLIDIDAKRIAFLKLEVA